MVKYEQHENNLQLLDIKKRGKLTQPSDKVIHLCKITETVDTAPAPRHSLLTVHTVTLA